LRRLVVPVAAIVVAGSICASVVSAGLLSARTVAGLIPIRGLETAAAANVRTAMPSVEAYAADHGSYAGMTDAALRGYGSGTKVHVAWANRSHYCVQSVLVSFGRSFAAHVVGPSSNIVRGTC
jgi:hypothetical protein